MLFVGNYHSHCHEDKMLTKEEWDIIAKCVANHPPYIDHEKAMDLLQKLSQLTDCEKDQVCYDSS